MPRARLARQLTLLAFVALCPALALALDERYEGVLQPDNRDPSIPIVVELREVGPILQGSVKTSAPLKGSAPIDSGSNVYGQCAVTVELSKTVTLRLSGRCERSAYAGIYTLSDKQKRTVTIGSFNLARKAPEGAELDRTRITSMASTATGCMKANAQCLVACPRGDESAEFMCSNHCRVKLRLCKSHIKKPPPETE